MPIKNPYGVGDSGQQAGPIKITCQCCRMPYAIIAGPRTPILRRVCSHCETHELSDGTDQRAIAYQDHAQRALEMMETAYQLLRDGIADRDAALAERKRFGQMLYEANEDRDDLRNHLAALWKVHPESPDGTCGCGADPCPTRDEAQRLADESGRYRSRWLTIPPRNRPKTDEWNGVDDEHGPGSDDRLSRLWWHHQDQPQCGGAREDGEVQPGPQRATP